jgi:hypothetical protein
MAKIVVNASRRQVAKASVNARASTITTKTGKTKVVKSSTSFRDAAKAAEKRFKGSMKLLA